MTDPSNIPHTPEEYKAVNNGEHWKPAYTRWRHGGWYVSNLHHPNGGCGCVSRNYPDRKWRIVCDERLPQPTYPNRDAAAFAEREIIETARQDNHSSPTA